MQTPVTAIQALKIARQESKRALALSPRRAGPLQTAIEALNDAIRDEEDDPAQPGFARRHAQAEPAAAEQHKCCAIACPKMIGAHMAFCRPHWFALRADLKQRITTAYSAWTDGQDPASRQAHMAVIKEAVIYLRDNQTQQRSRRA